MQDSVRSRVTSHWVLATAPSPHCYLCELMNISEIFLTFSFGPDGRYPTLSEFYHRGICAPPCTTSIGTWTDGRGSEDHSRDEFRGDVPDIGLALVKAMRLYQMIYIYICICISFPEGILASIKLSTISSDLSSP